MSIYVNVGGAQKELSPIYNNISGAQHEMMSIDANINNASKNIYQKTYKWYKYTYDRYSSYRTLEEKNEGGSASINFTSSFVSAPDRTLGSSYRWSGNTISLRGGVNFSYTGPSYTGDDYIEIEYSSGHKKYGNGEDISLNGYWVIIYDNHFRDTVDTSLVYDGSAKVIELGSMTRYSSSIYCAYRTILGSVLYYRYRCTTTIVSSTNPNEYPSSSYSWLGSDRDSTSYNYVYGDSNVYYRFIS